MKHKIVTINGPPEKYYISNLSTRIDSSKLEVKKYQPEDKDSIQALEEASLIIAFPGKIYINKKILETAKKVQLIHFLSVGYDNIDLEAATQLGILVANNPGWPSISVAEHTIMLTLMTLKQATKMYTKTIQKAWKGGDYPPRYELHGKTLGLLGLGSIGKEVVKLSHGFEVNIIYHKRNRLSKKEEESLGVSYSSFDELLRESDVLSIHVPLTEETRGLISVDEIAKMKKTAIIVNTARKAVVDEAAVFDALNSERLFGFGTDFEPDHSLTGLENVCMTPHSSVTPEAMLRMTRQGFENIFRFLDGKMPHYTVNKIEL
jgi:lactate dehydrogenase-like 2-hydroxyacid dehydrogenase